MTNLPNPAFNTVTLSTPLTPANGGTGVNSLGAGVQSGFQADVDTSGGFASSNSLNAVGTIASEALEKAEVLLFGFSYGGTLASGQVLGQVGLSLTGTFAENLAPSFAGCAYGLTAATYLYLNHGGTVSNGTLENGTVFGTITFEPPGGPGSGVIESAGITLTAPYVVTPTGAYYAEPSFSNAYITLQGTR